LSNSSTNTKQSIIDAYSVITLVGKPACYQWFYSGQWFACGFIYSDKKYGKLIVIQYGENENYILKCLESQITLRRFDSTVI
jgi:hypothetical protein